MSLNIRVPFVCTCILHKQEWPRIGIKLGMSNISKYFFFNRWTVGQSISSVETHTRSYTSNKGRPHLVQWSSRQEVQDNTGCQCLVGISSPSKFIALSFGGWKLKGKGDINNNTFLINISWDISSLRKIPFTLKQKSKFLLFAENCIP